MKPPRLVFNKLVLFILLSYDFKGAWDSIQVKGAVSPNFIEIKQN